MSLINDALKRASQSERNRPRELSSPVPMQPVPDSHRSSLPAVIGVCVVVLLAAAGWLVFRSFAPVKVVAPTPMPLAVAPATPASISQAPAPKAPIPAPAPAPVAVAASPVVLIPPGAPTPVVAAEPPPAPLPFPELKLGGILYSRANPKVIINGQIRGENQKIGEVRIVKILPGKVTVEWNGQTKDLALEEQ